MPAEWFRKYPVEVHLPDGRVFYSALLLHLGDDLAVFATRAHYPDGEPTRTANVVRLATFPLLLADGTRAKVRTVEKDRWTIPTDDGDVLVVASGSCGCYDKLKTWRP